VAKIARKNKLITMIDSTFASPVNQNPIDLGIDVVLHSGTKYIGGHSDLMCGFALWRNTGFSNLLPGRTKPEDHGTSCASAE
jgi:cystathionine beta-lyase/cystathionine gamma-synthase